MESSNVPAALSVQEFCRAHRISRALFYVLMRNGRAPRLMRIGRRTLISAEAAAAWRRQMEADTSARAAA